MRLSVYIGMIIDTQKFTGEIVELIGAIDAFNGRWQVAHFLKPEILLSLKTTTIVSSSGSSTRIEGAKLSDDEVAGMLGNLGAQRIVDRDHTEVRGYIETLQTVFEQFGTIPLSENMIKGLHKELLRYVEKDQHHLGEYKKQPNTVKAYDAHTGQEVGIVFEPTDPALTPIEMERLVSETAAAWQGSAQHKLLIIGEFVVRFLAIHPFKDGNGRLSRILTNLLLLKAGYDFIVYASHEKVIEDNKDRYYAALRHTQARLKGDTPDLMPWLEFFLRCLKEQTEYLEQQIKLETSLKKLHPIESDIMTLVRQRGKATNSMVVAAYGHNPNTVKARFRNLVSAGVLKAEGKGKGRYYILAR